MSSEQDVYILRQQLIADRSRVYAATKRARKRRIDDLVDIIKRALSDPSGCVFEGVKMPGFPSGGKGEKPLLEATLPEDTITGLGAAEELGATVLGLVGVRLALDPDSALGEEKYSSTTTTVFIVTGESLGSIEPVQIPENAQLVFDTTQTI